MGTIRGDNLRGRITSLLLYYILVPVPVKYLPMELGGKYAPIARRIPGSIYLDRHHLLL